MENITEKMKKETLLFYSLYKISWWKRKFIIFSLSYWFITIFANTIEILVHSNLLVLGKDSVNYSIIENFIAFGFVFSIPGSLFFFSCNILDFKLFFQELGEEELTKKAKKEKESSFMRDKVILLRLNTLFRYSFFVYLISSLKFFI